MENVKNEFLSKADKIRALLKDTGAEGIEVSSQTNFSWLTGGRGFVGLASEGACASLLIGMDGVYLLANNIESPRLLDEEVRDLADTLQVRSFPWHSGSRKEAIIKEALGGKKCVTDAQLSKDFRNLRSHLTDAETDRYQGLGKTSAEVVEDICREIKPGVSEFEIAGKVSSALWSKGIEPITALIAFDERISSYRHPLPTAKKLVKYAMIVVCTRKHGLVASLTRLVSLGGISKEIAAKHRAVAEIDACFINATRPGATTREIFSKAVNAYAGTGFKNEWELHHQGGLTGYEAREYIATMDSVEVVAVKQAYAWNPSITGTKSEDTIIVGAAGNRIITHTGKYVYLEAEYEGVKVLRPDILVL